MTYRDTFTKEGMADRRVERRCKTDKNSTHSLTETDNAIMRSFAYYKIVMVLLGSVFFSLF